MLEDDDDSQAVAVRLVVDVGDAFDLLVVDHVGDLLDHLGLVDHVGNLRDDDALAAGRRKLDVGLGAHHHAAAARQHRLLHTLVAVDDTARGEVGTFDEMQQLLARDLRVVDVGAAGVHHLREVVRSHVRSHTHGDTAGAVDDQQRNFRRQNRRFGDRIVEVERPVDRFLVDVGHYFVRDFLHAGFGVTHGSRRVAVHRTEVTLAVDQRVAHRPVLRQADHRVVDRRVAVGVELTEHVTDDTGGLTGGFVGVEVELRAHIVEDAAVHGFHTVAHVRQCSRHDDRHRVIDVRRLHLLFDIDGDDTSRQTGILFFFS